MVLRVTWCNHFVGQCTLIVIIARDYGDVILAESYESSLAVSNLGPRSVARSAQVQEPSMKRVTFPDSMTVGARSGCVMQCGFTNKSAWKKGTDALI